MFYILINDYISGKGFVVSIILSRFGTQNFGRPFLENVIFEIGRLSGLGLTYDAVWPAPGFREPVLIRNTLETRM